MQGLFGAHGLSFPLESPLNVFDSVQPLTRHVLCVHCWLTGNSLQVNCQVMRSSIGSCEDFLRSTHRWVMTARLPFSNIAILCYSLGYFTIHPRSTPSFSDFQLYLKPFFSIVLESLSVVSLIKNIYNTSPDDLKIVLWLHGFNNFTLVLVEGGCYEIIDHFVSSQCSLGVSFPGCERSMVSQDGFEFEIHFLSNCISADVGLHLFCLVLQAFKINFSSTLMKLEFHNHVHDQI
jgi:hypothetical protein